MEKCGRQTLQILAISQLNAQILFL